MARRLSWSIMYSPGVLSLQGVHYFLQEKGDDHILFDISTCCYLFMSAFSLISMIAREVRSRFLRKMNGFVKFEKSISESFFCCC